jgi:hypothetical protein
MRLALVVLAACGRVGFTPLISTTGDDASGDGIADIDARPVTGRHWVNRNLSDPGPLTAARMAYDSKRGRILMYGGSNVVQSAALWAITGAGWTSICTSCPPGQRAGPGVAYDPIRDRLVVFGGANLGGEPVDTWEYAADTNQWTQTATTGPGQHAQGELYFDRARGKVILVGGINITSTPQLAAWSYDGAWVDLQLANAPAAGGFGQAVTYDLDRAGALVLSGIGGAGAGDDGLYELDASWKPVCTTCSGTVRRDASIVFDRAMHTAWLINGTTGGGDLAGTWQLATNAWTMKLTDPPARSASAVGYDESRDVIVLYGGAAAACTNQLCSDTWELVPD